MKKQVQTSLIGLLCLLYTNAFAAPPNDDCANAITLTVGSSCSTTAGTTASATQSAPACSGYSEDDVWYKFVANQTNATITVAGSSSFDAVVQLLSGGCSGTQLYCEDDYYAGTSEVISATGLTIGNTYYLRVYEYSSGTVASPTFTICVTSISTTIPSNDNCANAILLPVVSSKSTTTSGTTLNATASTATGCNGTADDDVWYKFVANSAKDSIYVVGGSSFDAMVQVFSGGCSGTSMSCTDGSGSGYSEDVYLTGLTVGQTYYIRLYHYFTGSSSTPDFEISVYKYGSVVSGTEEASSTSKLSLYPNPAKNELNLNLSAFDAQVTLEVIDAKGNRVMQQSLIGGNESSVNVEALENGVYTAKISSGNHFSTEKFVIVK